MNAKILLLQAVLPQVLGQIVHALPQESLLVLADKALTFGEEAIKSSPTKIDDVTLLPVIQQLRAVQGIPHFVPDPATGKPVRAK